MINNYEGAEIIELGNAQDIVLGEKIIDNQMESLTAEWGRYIPATND